MGPGYSNYLNVFVGSLLEHGEHAFSSDPHGEGLDGDIPETVACGNGFTRKNACKTRFLHACFPVFFSFLCQSSLTVHQNVKILTVHRERGAHTT